MTCTLSKDAVLLLTSLTHGSRNICSKSILNQEYLLKVNNKDTSTAHEVCSSFNMWTSNRYLPTQFLLGYHTLRVNYVLMI